MRQLKQDLSFVEKYPLKYILVVCLFLVFMDIFSFIKIFFLKQSINFIPWFPFVLGLNLILMAIISVKYQIEKMAVIVFGTALILDSFIKSSNYRLFILILIILLELIGTYCFWLASKIYNKHRQELDKEERERILKRLSVAIIIILFPVLFFWLLRIIASR